MANTGSPEAARTKQHARIRTQIVGRYMRTPSTRARIRVTILAVLYLSPLFSSSSKKKKKKNTEGQSAPRSDIACVQGVRECVRAYVRQTPLPPPRGSKTMFLRTTGGG